MQKQSGTGSSKGHDGLTRRTVLGGMVTAALMPTLIAGAVAAQAEGPGDLGDPVMSPTGIPMPRGFHTITALHDGRLLITGGVGMGNRALSSALIYDPVRTTWTEVASMNMARFQHAAIQLADGRVLVTGGLNRTSSPIHTSEIYSPNTDSWSPAPSLLMGRYGHSMAALHNGTVLVTGGFLDGPLASVEIYAAGGDN